MFKGTEVQQYIIILKEADKLCLLLKCKWGANKDKNTEMQLREAYKIRNNAFVGLMREGFPCLIIKDFEIETNTISFAINIDNEIYECRENVVKDILNNDYQTIVDKCINIEDNIGDRKDIEDIIDPNVEYKFNNSINNNHKPTLEENICVEITDSEKNAQDIKHNKTKETINNIPKKEIQTEKTKNSDKKVKHKSSFSYIEPNKPETRKKLDTMLFDFNDVGVINKENKTGEYVNFTIAPLSIPSNGDAFLCDIFVCMETNERKKIFVSEKKGSKTVSTKIGEYEFLVKGSFENGKFSSEIYPANNLTSNEYIKKENKTSYTPKDFKAVGFGHVVDFIENEDKSISKIHIIPLELENNGTGMVNIMVCVENPDDTRQTYVADDNMIIHKTGKLTYQIFGYWENNEFISKIKLRN